MSDSKRQALTDLTPAWSITPPLRHGELVGAFRRDAPRLLDVGVGTGEATIDWATRHPDWDVIAVELHRPGIARVLQVLDDDGPTNVRILEADVTAVVADLADQNDPAAAQVINAVRILFPDPWPKRRHLHRRLVDEAFVATVADIVAPGGWLHLATDWDDYALQMRLALMAEPRLEVDVDGAALRPERPVTTYEGRGLLAGRHITDLIAHRRD